MRLPIPEDAFFKTKNAPPPPPRLKCNYHLGCFEPNLFCRTGFGPNRTQKLRTFTEPEVWNF